MRESRYSPSRMRTPAITWAYIILWFFAFYLALASVFTGIRLRDGDVSIRIAVPVFLFAIGHVLALIALYFRGKLARVVVTLVSLLHILYLTVTLMFPPAQYTALNRLSAFVLFIIWMAGSTLVGLPIYIVWKKSSKRYLGL